MSPSENKPVVIESSPLAMDNQYNTIGKTNMKLKKTYDSKTSYALKDGNDKVSLYVTLNHKDKNVISNMMRETIIKFRILEKGDKDFKLHIYKGDKEMDEQIVNITFKKSFSNNKFEMEYESKEGKSELLEARIYPDSEIEIYCGRRKEGGHLLCKATQPKVFSNSYSIEFSQGVDMVFLTMFLITIIKCINSEDGLAFVAIGLAFVAII